jgi:hypothetical protein
LPTGEVTFCPHGFPLESEKMVLVKCILDFEAEQVLLTHFFHNLKIEGAGNGF